MRHLPVYRYLLVVRRCLGLVDTSVEVCVCVCVWQMYAVLILTLPVDDRYKERCEIGILNEVDSAANYL